MARISEVPWYDRVNTDLSQTQNMNIAPDEQRRNRIRYVRRQIAALDAKRAVLASLLAKLETHSPEPDPPRSNTSARTGSLPARFSDADVQLFMRLFQGRMDVFPQCWDGRNGRSGYAPACRNEWVPGICGKPAVKCAECVRRQFIPMTPNVVRDHLAGRRTVGVYALLKDETCHFLAMDFDKKEWMDDVNAVRETCQDKGVSCAVERSRSGTGAHLWFFFDKPVSARLARRFGCALLTATMERRHQIGLDSYDRLFPSQDTMPKGGFGNLIALPFQARPATQGNSLFIDADSVPYRDQWAFLRSLTLLGEEQIRTIEEEAARKGSIVGVRLGIDDESRDRPWMIPPSGRRTEPVICGNLPERVTVVYSDLLYVPKQGLPSGLVNRIVRLAAFQNPEFYQAQAMRLSTFGKPRVVSCAEDFDQHIAVPRGCLEELRATFAALNVRVEIDDQRTKGNPLDVRFEGSLRPEQERAMADLMQHDIGVLVGPTAFGKTVVGAKLIAERAVNTVVLVHRKQLLDQWRASLASFLGLNMKSIGQIGSGKSQATGSIDVAMIQSLRRKGVVSDRIADYGQIIVDECHHLSAFTFEQVLKKARAKFVVGLTATPTRKDGHHPIICMQCGPIRFAISPRKAAQQRGFDHRVVVRETDTTAALSGDNVTIHTVLRAIASDACRNEAIGRDVREAVAAGRIPLILTERSDHLESIAQQLADLGNSLFILHGGLRDTERKEIIDRFRNVDAGGQRILLATGKYIGEGFDDARLDTLFLASPISWRGLLEQYAGRLHRAHHAKREVIIHDYVDRRIPMAVRMFERRKTGYAALGYRLDNLSQPCLFSG